MGRYPRGGGGGGRGGGGGGSRRRRNSRCGGGSGRGSLQSRIGGGTGAGRASGSLLQSSRGTASPGHNDSRSSPPPTPVSKSAATFTAHDCGIITAKQATTSQTAALPTATTEDAVSQTTSWPHAASATSSPTRPHATSTAFITSSPIVAALASGAQACAWSLPIVAAFDALPVASALASGAFPCSGGDASAGDAARPPLDTACAHQARDDDATATAESPSSDRLVDVGGSGRAHLAPW